MKGGLKRTNSEIVMVRGRPTRVTVFNRKTAKKPKTVRAVCWLAKLPLPLIHTIIEFMSPRDLGRVRYTCRQASAFLKEPYVSSIWETVQGQTGILDIAAAVLRKRPEFHVLGEHASAENKVAVLHLPELVSSVVFQIYPPGFTRCFSMGSLLLHVSPSDWFQFYVHVRMYVRIMTAAPIGGVFPANPVPGVAGCACAECRIAFPGIY